MLGGKLGKIRLEQACQEGGNTILDCKPVSVLVTQNAFHDMVAIRFKGFQFKRTVSFAQR